MEGVIRQLYDYDGSNLFPHTRPDALVSQLQDSENTGIETIGELIDSSTPGKYTQGGAQKDYEPEFIYRISASDSNNMLGGADPSGTLKAVRLSEVAALHFDAVLSANFTVSNTVGNATAGRTYPAGTPLETIIKDMLTGGSTPPTPQEVYDVIRALPLVSFTNVKYRLNNSGSYSSLSNGATITVEPGDTVKVQYSFQYTDGKYTPENGYTSASFAANNNITANNGYYVSGSSPRLNAGCNPTLRLRKSSAYGDTINSHPYQSTTESAVINEDIDISAITTGSNQVYYITLEYAAGISTPYKSNGVASNKKITSGGQLSTNFHFTIAKAFVAIYDVYALTPLDLVEEYGWTGFNFDNIDPYSNVLHAQNGHARERKNGDVSTLWTDDTLIIGLPKYFDPSISGTTYYGPAFLGMPVGMFKPNADYTDDLFVTNNANTFVYSDEETQDNPYIPAGCDYTEPITIELQRKLSGGSYEWMSKKNIGYGSTLGDNVIKRVNTSAENPNTSSIVTTSYDLRLEYYNNALFNVNASIVSANYTYRLLASIPYTASTAVPKRSDNSDSSVNITAANLSFTTGDLVVNKEADVTKTVPSAYIVSVYSGGNSYNNGGYINTDASTIIGMAAIQLTDGTYGPTADYPLVEFRANHSDILLDGTETARAKCGSTNSCILKINGSTVGSSNADFSSTAGSTIYISFAYNIANASTLNFELVTNYSAGETEPLKRSTRPSTNTITAGTITSEFKLHVTGPQTYSLSLNTDGHGKVAIRQPDNSYAYNTTATEAGIVANTSKTIQARANSGYEFNKWEVRSGTVNASTANPYTFNMPAGNVELRATFTAAATTTYHFVVVTTTDDDVNATYTQVDQLLASGNTIHCNKTQTTIPSTYTDTDTYGNPNIGVGKKVFVIAAPIEYKSAAMYVGADNQQFDFTIIPATSSNNGIPYSSSDNTVYRLFKFKSESRYGYYINKIELKKS